MLGAGCHGGSSSDSADAGKQEARDSSTGDSGGRSTSGPGVGHDASAADAATDAAVVGMDGSAAVPANCPVPAPNQPPELLSCTALYGDIIAKKVNSGVHEFAPAVALWSDGAEKTRWIYLPAGQKIDISDPESWRFPTGTRLWQELKVAGKRVETRFFWKVSATFWARTAYRWNDTGTEAMRTGGEDLPNVTLGATTYHIPSTTECDTCHKGQRDRALGFEEILLGLPGATGFNLAALQQRGLLTGGTVPAKIEIGDDGTGHGRDALGWLHVNCGVSCHNDNSASEAYSTKLRLKLKVSDADGSSTQSVDALTTTVGVDAVTGRWKGQVRIVPGTPSKSLLYVLMSTRTPTTTKNQMPPIGSRVVPKVAAQLISDWITAIPPK